LLLAGFLAISICCHALAHWLAGRLVGIRFRAYGVRGTDHPDTYPPRVRQLMSAMPFFTAMTQKPSMQRARPGARALTFAAGEMYRGSARCWQPALRGAAGSLTAIFCSS
jgi:hypothetical protein